MPVKIALGVTGCIGAYKAALILRSLQEMGADVEVVMTRHACEFVQPLTFQALSGKPVIAEMFGPQAHEIVSQTGAADIKHISLAQEIDLLLIAPATANILAKFARGIADDFLSTLHLSTPAPLLIAPAMNVEMWRHPAVKENVAILELRGVRFIYPESGYLACRMEGEGRLADTDKIAVQAMEIAEVWSKRKASGERPCDMAGEHVLVTAGPTREYIDPVRFVSNRSSGKMGYAIAEAALARGAEVTLVSGPASIPPPAGAKLLKVETTREMYEAVMKNFEKATIIIKSAAVCDYRPQTPAEQKIKKSGENLSITLETTEDILAALGKAKGDRALVGFAAETESLLENAAKKLASKNLDMIVANDVSAADAGFDVDTNRATIIKRDGSIEQMPLLTKRETADRILDAVLQIKSSVFSHREHRDHGEIDH